jgi:HAD superfamily hydrolase (TIGR01509 family)
MIKGAIFDLDGTLLDSMFIWDTIGEEYLRSLGIEPRENLAETFKTFTLEESAEYYRTHYGVTLSVEEIADGVNGMIEDFYRNTVPLKNGVAEFLERLAEDDVKMCIATVTDRYLVEAALERLGIKGYFSEIFTTAEVGCTKTTPQIYRRALAHLGTEKSETVVFEDAFHALMTAKNDGFPVAAVYDVHELRQMEMKDNGDYYITDFETIQI